MFLKGYVMKRITVMLLLAASLVFCMVAVGCGGSTSTSASSTSNNSLADGVYTVDFDTDYETMFHVNEAYDGKAKLTVKNGEMTVHVVLESKKIVNLFCGKAEDAKKEGAKLIEPTTETVTYSDGLKGEAYAFDIPVPALDEEFDVALIGTHGNWYDHKVTVSNPVADKS